MVTFQFSPSYVMSFESRSECGCSDMSHVEGQFFELYFPHLVLFHASGEESGPDVQV